MVTRKSILLQASLSDGMIPLSAQQEEGLSSAQLDEVNLNEAARTDHYAIGKRLSLFRKIASFPEISGPRMTRIPG